MDTSDDPNTLLFPFKPEDLGLGAGAKGGIASTAAKRIGEGGPEGPEKRTAAARPQGTQAAQQNRKRKASFFTRNFPLPQLSTPGLLG